MKDLTPAGLLAHLNTIVGLVSGYSIDDTGVIPSREEARAWAEWVRLKFHQDNAIQAGVYRNDWSGLEKK